jgi:hypothetical protein
MKIAVGTTGDNLDAWVGSEFSWWITWMPG